MLPVRIIRYCRSRSPRMTWWPVCVPDWTFAPSQPGLCTDPRRRGGLSGIRVEAAGTISNVAPAASQKAEVLILQDSRARLGARRRAYPRDLQNGMGQYRGADPLARSYHGIE